MRGMTALPIIIIALLLVLLVLVAIGFLFVFLFGLFIRKGSNAPVPADPRTGVIAHILLLIFTFGIWGLIWNYRTTAFLNCVEGEEFRNPATKILLCMFVPFYNIYWLYKSGQRVDTQASRVGVESDIAVLCLVFAFLFPIISYVLIQARINDICNARV